MIALAHPCVLDPGNPCRDDGSITCVDMHALARSFKCYSHGYRFRNALKGSSNNGIKPNSCNLRKGVKPIAIAV